MKHRTRIGILMGLGLCTLVRAEAVSLSVLKQSDLTTLSQRLSDVRRSRRLAVRTVAESDADIADVLLRLNGEQGVRVVSVERQSVGTAVGILQAREEVLYAEPNSRLQRQSTPSDPLLGSQWHHEKIGSAEAWDWGLGSAEVKVAIVDVPFNFLHPDLAANAAASGWDVVNEVPLFSGDDNHASMSAGLIGAVVNNGVGVAGLGNFTLVAVNNAYRDLSSDIEQMDAAIRWAAVNGVRVVNLSWDGAYSAVLNDAAQFLRETTDGIVVMSGVNGSGYLDYASQPYIIAVSMTDRYDQLQSHYGPHIDFSAPGENIYSTSSAGYMTDSGTSYSAPLVAGLFAALFSINPSLSAEQAIEVVQATAEDLGEPGWDSSYGWGRIDFGKAAWVAAASAGLVDSLGGFSMDHSLSNLLFASEYHRGMRYQLLRTTNLTTSSWTAVPSGVVTNGAILEFSVEPDAGQGFFKVEALPVFE